MDVGDDKTFDSSLTSCCRDTVIKYMSIKKFKSLTRLLDILVGSQLYKLCAGSKRRCGFEHDRDGDVVLCGTGGK